MKLTERTVTELLAAFRSSEPTPGGGSAAALAGAVGASLLAMVAGLPKPKASDERELTRLKTAGDRCADIARQLEILIDRDSEAYDMVVAAFRLPRSSDEEKAARTAAIHRAMVAATEAPLEAMRRSAEALAAVPVVSELGNQNASSDVQVAAALLGAAVQGAEANVDINLGSIKDAEYAAAVRREIRMLTAAREDA